jgi:hypothetical protein
LVLASRSVTIKSVSTIGKTKEHLRLNIEDQNGNTQSILWWGGAGEELPEEGSKFDIAYSLRASSYRGQKQVTLQFEEFRVIRDAEQPVEINKHKLKIIDQRSTLSVDAFDKLRAGSLALNGLIWAEGADKPKGKSRFELQAANEFAIYTTPPSPAELRKALEVVKPKTISVFAIPPAEERPEDYLNRLAGLCKYAIKNYEGKTTLEKFAVAMASREIAVKIGLEWLAAGGQLSVGIEEDAVNVSAEKREKNPYLQAELFTALKGVLNETSAYRKYFATVDLKTIF